MAQRLGGALGAAVCGLGIACGGGGTAPGTHGPTLSKASPSGDGQSAPVGTTLPEPLRVVLTQDGNPVAGQVVSWSLLASGGATNPATSTTGADGIASTSIVLPSFAATVTVTAIAGGVSQAVRFSVTSTGATGSATVQVANNDFLPSNVQLTAGGTVSFVWLSGSGPHNVTPVAPNTIPSSDNPPPPGTHDAPYDFDTRFPLPGSFIFFCEVHGSPTSGMRGTVTVVP